MLGRLVRAADFERVLASKPCARSTHFAVHHVQARPGIGKRRLAKALASNLSTGPAPSCAQAVDESPDRVWLGAVLPKRHARRAVTRGLLKRQIRGSFASLALPTGLWLVRLRCGFETKAFASAASTALRCAVRHEIESLMSRFAKTV
jgi:ribonuclease P protein component